MEKFQPLTMTLQPEERARLLDTVISELAKVQVDVFQERDPKRRASLEQKRQHMEAIMKKLCSVGEDTRGSEHESRRDSQMNVREKAA